MTEKKQGPVYNAAGTHVYVITPANGLQWECPVAALDLYLGEPWNYILTEPRDDSLDDLVDEAPSRPAKKAAKDINPGD